MGNRGLLIGAVLAVVLGTLFISRQSQPAVAQRASRRGRNNTILFLTNSENGLSNVHLATSFALLERHPSCEVHFASFHKQARRVHDISEAVLAKNSSQKPIRFHEIRGRTMLQTLEDSQLGWEVMIGPPGHEGADLIAREMERYLSAWEAQEHYDIFLQIQDIIESIDPAVVVLDPFFVPGIDAARNLDRLHAFIAPNPVADCFPDRSPRLQILWKYPALGSGHPYPVPLRLIPHNIAMVVRMGLKMIRLPQINAKREFLAARGVREPINHPMRAYRPDCPWIASQVDGAALPFDPLPANVTVAGPIVISTAPAAEQDPALAAWLSRRPTVLINMGSLFWYREDHARAMAGALAEVLRRTDVQVLWKFRKQGGYGDEYQAPIAEHVASGRVRIEGWLAVDPMALMETGHVVAFVHHGGANSYTEAVA